MDQRRRGGRAPMGERRRMIEQRPVKSARRELGELDETRQRQRVLGDKLREMFDEVVQEPVPDEFLEILRRHDERKSGKD